MSVIYIVLPLALLIALVALLGFAWATRRGQFDDLETPRHRMLLDDDPVSEENTGGPVGPSVSSSAGSGPAKPRPRR